MRVKFSSFALAGAVFLAGCDELIEETLAERSLDVGDERQRLGIALRDLLVRHSQLGLDRYAGEPDHDLVRKIHDHEQEQQEGNLPGALGDP